MFNEGDIIKVMGGQYEGLVGEIAGVPDNDYEPYKIVTEESQSIYWFKAHELELLEPASVEEYEESSLLTFDEYQEQSRKTAFYPSIKMNNGTHREINWVYVMLGLGGECGEISEKLKKILRDKNGIVSEEDKSLIAKEIGDLCWYVSQLCSELGLSYEQVHRDNLIKLFDRQKRGKLSGSGDNR